jgi:hypothetical protein
MNVVAIDQSQSKMLGVLGNLKKLLHGNLLATKHNLHIQTQIKVNTRVDRCMDAWMHGCMDAWMHGCMDAWMHGCMDAWMHRQSNSIPNTWKSMRACHCVRAEPTAIAKEPFQCAW